MSAGATVSVQERVRRLLAERLGYVGVSPDLRNDGPAVRAIAAQTGLALEQVVDQLVVMRTEACQAMARRLGAELSAGALVQVAAQRDALLRSGSLEEDRGRYAQAFERRAQQDSSELRQAVGLRPTVAA